MPQDFFYDARVVDEAEDASTAGALAAGQRIDKIHFAYEAGQGAFAEAAEIVLLHGIRTWGRAGNCRGRVSVPALSALIFFVFDSLSRETQHYQTGNQQHQTCRLRHEGAFKELIDIKQSVFMDGKSYRKRDADSQGAWHEVRHQVIPRKKKRNSIDAKPRAYAEKKTGCDTVE